MWAIAALVCFALAFILKLVGTSLGDFDLVILGFCFVALYLVFGVGVPRARRP